MEFCKFCHTSPSSGETTCQSLKEATEVTNHHPLGCPWFTEEDRRWSKDQIMTEFDRTIAMLRS